MSSAMSLQDADKDAWFTFGANEAACPRGGRSSEGPGFRKQHRAHDCYQADGTKTAPNEALLKGWIWGSYLAAAGAALLLARGTFASAKAARYRLGNDALAS